MYTIFRNVAPLIAGALLLFSPLHAAAGTTNALSLADCLSRGLAGNRQLELFRLQMASASADVQFVSAVYDTRIGLDGTWLDSDLPPGAFPSPGGYEKGQALGRVEREFASGTTLGVELDAQRNLFDGSSSESEPTWRSSASLTARQSLWRNAFGGANEARVEYTRMRLDSLQLEYERLRDEVAARIEDAYWSAAVARRIAESQVRIVERLRELSATYARRVEDGLLDETALLSVDASLAVAEVDVEVLEYEAQARDEELKERIDVPAIEWDAVRIAYDLSEDCAVGADEDFAAVFARALRHRPDVQALAEEDRRVEQLIRLRELEDRSDVQIAGSIGRGDSDTERSEAWGFDQTVWSVGIAVDISLGRSASRAALTQAFLERERIRVRRDQLERDIALDVRTAIRQVRTANRLVEATRRALDLQERKLAAEDRRFDRGQSDVKTVLDYRNDRDLAERDHLKAIGGACRASVHLRLVTGESAGGDAP